MAALGAVRKSEGALIQAAVAVASGIDEGFLAANTSAFVADPKNEVARIALQTNAVSKIAIDRERLRGLDSHVFSNKVTKEGDPTNQKSSGRCWQFAALNLIRRALIKKYNLPTSFELSQTYLFFFDKIERSNWFLDEVISTASEEVGSRIVQHLLSNPTEDGGQWDMMVALLLKYGVVPKDVMGEVDSSSASHRMNWFLASKLREFAAVLRDAVSQGASAEVLGKMKGEMLSCIHRILLANIGIPPQKFDWSFYDKDGKHTVMRDLTPQAILALSELDLGDMVSVIDDPRNPRLASYTVDKLGNVVGGRAVRYINLDTDRLKALVRECIEKDESVWFGCDVGKYYSADASVMDVDMWRYDLLYGTKFNLNKEQRLLYGSSLMTHAMVITGFDKGADESTTTKWRIENSWGKDRGAGKGYLTMSDSWFSEFVYQIVVPRSMLTAEENAAYDAAPTVLPAWDPMGALA